MRHLFSLTALGLVFLLLPAPPIVRSATPIPAATGRELEQWRILNTIFEIAAVKEPIFMILVNKARQNLQVLKHNGRLQIVEEYPCATGENPGTKKVSGDACTPEGVYFITKIYKDNKISIFGNRAFHLDYPNIFDSINGKNGNGIYIHGTNKPLVPYSTNGCITMRNKDLDLLVKYLDNQATPVVIVEDMEQQKSKPAKSLSAHDFKLAKSLLPPSEIDQDAIHFDNLYSIRFGTQAVVVGDFVHQKYEHSRNRGHSRVYLEFSNEHGWQTRKRLWHITQSVIFPDNPIKLLAHKPIKEEVYIPPQTTAAIALAKSKQRIAQLQTANLTKPIQPVGPIVRKTSAPEPRQLQQTVWSNLIRKFFPRQSNPNQLP